jgi:hypothetical protein
MMFERADGRVIPRFGYRLEDMRDDYVVAATLTERRPSAEVREVAPRYAVA